MVVRARNLITCEGFCLQYLYIYRITRIIDWRLGKAGTMLGYPLGRAPGPVVSPTLLMTGPDALMLPNG